MKRLIPFLVTMCMSLTAFGAWTNTVPTNVTLMVNYSNGVISGPVSADTFRRTNDIARESQRVVDSNTWHSAMTNLQSEVNTVSGQQNLASIAQGGVNDLTNQVNIAKTNWLVRMSITETNASARVAQAGDVMTGDLQMTNGAQVWLHGYSKLTIGNSTDSWLADASTNGAALKIHSGSWYPLQWSPTLLDIGNNTYVYPTYWDWNSVAWSNVPALPYAAASLATTVSNNSAAIIVLTNEILVVSNTVAALAGGTNSVDLRIGSNTTAIGVLNTGAVQTVVGSSVARTGTVVYISGSGGGGGATSDTIFTNSFVASPATNMISWTNGYHQYLMVAATCQIGLPRINYDEAHSIRLDLDQGNYSVTWLMSNIVMTAGVTNGTTAGTANLLDAPMNNTNFFYWYTLPRN